MTTTNKLHELPEGVDAIEVAACVDVGDGCMERVVDTHPGAVFSVYWHLAAGGADCFADFVRADDARRYAAAIAAEHGLPWWDFSA